MFTTVLAEVGVLPIKERIFCLFLRDLEATVSLSNSHLVKSGLLDNVVLAQTSKKGYYMNM